MAKSIMPFNVKNRCYICKANCVTDTHHVFQGSNRQKADDLGLTVELCRVCHKRAHEHPQEFEQRYHLKSNAQYRAMLKHNLSIDEWRAMFRKDYRE
jgi:hypothetical protein